jgi:hypothetical protein
MLAQDHLGCYCDCTREIAADDADALARRIVRAANAEPLHALAGSTG